MRNELKRSYQSRIENYQQLLQKTGKQANIIALVRLLVFLVALVMVYLFSRFNTSTGIVVSIFLGILFFLILVKYHSVVLIRKKKEAALLQVNQNERQAMDGNLDAYVDGEMFTDQSHPFATDLDLFGKKSIFQYLNRTSTYAGQRKLAERLCKPLQDKKSIESNQEAIQELSEDTDWRQKFQAAQYMYKESPNDLEKIIQWADSPAFFNRWYFRILLFTVPMLTFFMIWQLAAGSISVQVFLVYLVVPWGLAGSFARTVNARHNAVGKTTELLKKYAYLLQRIEEKTFASALLLALKRETMHKEIPASRSIKSLSAILTALDNRLNFVSWAVLNGLFIWDILQMVRLESWQKKHSSDVQDWFEVTGELDVLNCFATFRFNRPDTVFPVISEGPFQVDAKDAGHPLIDPDKRVDNDIRIREGAFILITGANMAGKSTYLRTIGVNLVLAMSGAPVCAGSFTFTPTQIFTSIRTADSLQENESYFYAELKRLKAIIDALKNGRKLFIILDEILKGTNSTDKHAGSEALLKQFLALKTTGIVATHDVSLGILQEKYPDTIRNHCFEVDIQGNQLHFDYKLRNGISKNMNATILMREMGITI
jgi:DNA mismatch repair ATPase MutS